MAISKSPQGTHDYAARLIWEGDLGVGTATYAGYGRQYRVEVAGKPDLAGSADPAFRGDPARHNPEDLFVASISACHMLTYLALCARQRIAVVAYEDDARGTMEVDARGGGRFTEVVLRPAVTLADPAAAAAALALHETAHELCFIAGSVSVPITCEPSIAGGP